MGKIKLLVAEDDKLLLELYEKRISDEKFEKRFAENGRQALEIYESWKPDVILLDIAMPIVSGFEVLKKIREIEIGWQSTAVIMATAMASKNDVKDCMKLGISGYLIKPIDFERLDEKIIGYYEKSKRDNKETPDP